MKRATPLKKESSAKRGRGVLNNSMDSYMLVTPNRVAAVRQQAKKKGLPTPSPGRAGAAFTMLQLNAQGGCGNTQALKQKENSGQTQSVRDVCEKLVEFFRPDSQRPSSLRRARLHVVDAQELELRCGINSVSLDHVMPMLVALGVVVLDDVSKLFVWVGFAGLKSGLERCIALGSKSTNVANNTVHLTRRVVIAAALMGQKQKGNTQPGWSERALGKTLGCGSENQNAVAAKLHDIMQCLLALNLVRLTQSVPVRYEWNTRGHHLGGFQHSTTSTILENGAPFSAAARNLIGTTGAKSLPSSAGSTKAKDADGKRTTGDQKSDASFPRPDDLPVLKQLRINLKPFRDSVARGEEDDDSDDTPNTQEVASDDDENTSDGNHSQDSAPSSDDGVKLVRMHSLAHPGDESANNMPRSETIDSMASLAMVMLNPEIVERDVASLAELPSSQPSEGTE